MNNQTEPTTSKHCSQCGGECISFAMGSKPFGRVKSALDQQQQFLPMDALICTCCGHTTFYTREPEKLRMQ